MRALKPHEIQCRAQIVKQKGFSLLLYKDARCDMNILDETFDPENWKNEYQEVNGNLFCTISIWDEDKEQWISKQDAGAESNTEAEKGHASDAFKRAGFRWGIGRELYTAPFIWIKDKGEVYKRNDGKHAVKSSAKFNVSEIDTVDGVIQSLKITDKNGNVRYSYQIDNPTKRKLKPNTDRWQKAVHHLAGSKVNVDYIRANYDITEDHLEQLTAESLQVSNDATG